MNNWNDLRVAIVAMDGFEESELVEPQKALAQAGARVEVLSPKPGEVVVDQNLVTSRGPEDLPAFIREMLQLLAQTPVESHR